MGHPGTVKMEHPDALKMGHPGTVKMQWNVSLYEWVSIRIEKMQLSHNLTIWVIINFLAQNWAIYFGKTIFWCIMLAKAPSTHRILWKYIKYLMSVVFGELWYVLFHKAN